MRNQKTVVIKYMQAHKRGISQREAYKMGIYRLSAVIFELRKAGHRIWTETKEVINADGSVSRVGYYHLRE